MRPEEVDDRWLWVATWPPVPLRALSHLLALGLTLGEALRAPRRRWDDAVRVLGARGRGPSPAECAATPLPRERIRAMRGALARDGARVVTWCDADYPAALRTIADAPPVLFVKGSLASDASVAWPEECAAVVGARRATPSGLEIASWLAGGLAARGVCVVSGLARGIDGAAHRGALAAGGTTIGVLGSALDDLYPPEHAMLARETAAAGLVVTEFVPGTPARKEFFPRRNRIIAGLSAVTVVVEAADRSGALVTARLATEQGRDVLAVPRDPLQPGCEGPNALLADGAAPARSADDILAAMGRGPATSGRAPAAESARGAGSAFASGSLAARVVAALDGRPRSVDEIAARVTVDRPAELLAVLAGLEMDGIVERTPGPRFRRIAGVPR